MKPSTTLLLVALATVSGCSSDRLDAPVGAGSAESTSSVEDRAVLPCPGHVAEKPQVMMAPVRGEYQGPVLAIDFALSHHGKRLSCEQVDIMKMVQKAIRIAMEDYRGDFHIDSIFVRCCPSERGVSMDLTSGEGDSSALIPIFRDHCREATAKEIGQESFFGAVSVLYAPQGEFL